MHIDIIVNEAIKSGSPQKVYQALNEFEDQTELTKFFEKMYKADKKYDAIYVVDHNNFYTLNFDEKSDQEGPGYVFHPVESGVEGIPIKDNMPPMRIAQYSVMKLQEHLGIITPHYERILFLAENEKIANQHKMYLDHFDYSNSIINIKDSIHHLKR